MTSKSLLLFTRTPLHVGAGASVGLVDQPVIRERHTGFPVIPGSSIKGVLRDHFARALTHEPKTVNTLFGTGCDDADAGAASGHLSFGEARLLAFPLRSAKGSYALATCPLALARYAREAGLKFPIPAVDSATALANSTLTLEVDRGANVAKAKRVALEEYVFEVKADFPKDWADHLAGLLDDAVLNGAKSRFVLLADGDFAHFALNACQINQHIRIDDETGTVADGALFNTETVPAETLFHATVTALRAEAKDNAVFKALAKETLFQFGGDATTGLGFCTAKLA